MKILTSRSSDDTSTGGGEMSARDHAIVLTKLGHDVVFVSSLPYLAKECEDNSIRFIRSLWAYQDYGIFRIPYFVAVWPLMWRHYAFIALKEKPDIIYPHSRDDQIIFTLLKPLHRRPVIWRDPSDLHYFLEKDNPRFVAWLYRWFLVKAIARSDMLFTLTEEEQQRIIKHSDGVADESSVQYFQSSIVYDAYNLNAKPHKKKTDKLVIGTMIRLVEDKGVQHLIKAFVRLADSSPDNELWIVGDGLYRPELEKLALNHPRITFWGQQTDQSMFFNSFDVFVQPANYEGWGRTIKEAMYFGVPIVGSDVGGIAVQITHNKNGLLFTPGSPIELEKQLKRLVESKELRQKLSKGGKEKARKDGDFMKLISEILVPAFKKALRGKS